MLWRYSKQFNFYFHVNGCPRENICALKNKNKNKHIPTRSPAQSPASSPPVPALTVNLESQTSVSNAPNKPSVIEGQLVDNWRNLIKWSCYHSLKFIFYKHNKIHLAPRGYIYVTIKERQDELVITVLHFIH